ncbi:TRAP transporter substrate-binding protein DctP [Alcaligenaceae bacterium]|nr:TRAP transporter substrate-binding protein DctP [Alcaligenaceae bacterium]
MFNIKKTLFFVGALATSLNATAAVSLRVADSLPVNHFIAKALIMPWMDRVVELTNKEVVFDYYPAEQLGKEKDMLALLQSGGADIAYFVPSYTPDKLPLSTVGEMPGIANSPCTGTMAYWDITKPGAFLDKENLSKQQVMMLMPLSLAPYQIQSVKRAVNNVDSFKGMKIRTSGDIKELTLLKLGATPVSMTATEIRDALSRGTIDGSALSFSSVPPYGIEEVVKYSTNNFDLGTAVLGYFFNKKSWERLPENIQQAMTQAANEIVPKACVMIQDLNQEDMEKVKAKGVKMVEFDKADQGKLDVIFKEVRDEWAENLEKRGHAGKKAVELLLEAIDKQQK